MNDQEELRQGCEPSQCGTLPACAGCHSNPANQHKEEKPKKAPQVRKVIGVISGKGGVGKSLVSAQLAVLLRRKGYEVGILDADITGPSVPKMFGVEQKAMGDGEQILPARTHNDIKLMSVNLLLEEEDTPVIWRGPVISGVVTQFWEDVAWGKLDAMVIDMPPGTGDVPLTVFQSIPVDGIVVVTTPQDLVGMIVRKAVHMANMMKIPVLGIVENMSYAVCPDCGKQFSIFGESHVEEEAAKLGLPVLARLPIDPQTARLCDEGHIERVDGAALQGAVDAIETKVGLNA